MSKHYEIHDNFLEEDYFKHLCDVVLHSGRFPWLYQENVALHEDSINDDVNQFYFVAPIFDGHEPKDQFHNLLQPLYYQLNVAGLIRSRMIMYTNTDKIIEHSPHRDMTFSHTAALLYMNTSNGYTRFENDEGGWDKVESIANRLVIHNGSHLHGSTTCTDQKKRIVLAINYFVGQ